MDIGIDTGTPCSIISINMLKSIKTKLNLIKTDRRFSSYTGHRIHCIGCQPVNVKINNKQCRLSLYVVEDNYDSLMGREWITL